MQKYKNQICASIVGFIFISITLAVWISPSNEFSYSERRKLSQFPTPSLTSVKDGRFMNDFESYTLDQFPLREKFRTIKAFSNYYLLGKGDNNKIYIKNGYAAKLEYPLNESSIEHAADKFRYIYDNFLKNKDVNIYLSIIPDKSYFIAEENGYPHMDYKKLFSLLQEKMEYAKYIDITETLDITDYYKTDTHWRQEKLIDTANELASQMGVSLNCEYTKNTLNNPFYGVYYGQCALPLPAESIDYLTNDILDLCTVTDYENNKTLGIYDFEKAYGNDPYQMFLSGSLSLLTIDNPAAKNDRELIIFRDSFGSSIAPLLVDGYSKITLVDIRYLRSDYLDKFIEFNNQDVLFLYSTLVLNNSETL